MVDRTATEALNHPSGGGVGDSSLTGDHVEPTVFADCAEEVESRRRDASNEVDDDGTQFVEQRVPGGDGSCRSPVEVDLVDVVVGQAVVDLAVEAYHLGGPRTGVGQHREGVVVELAQFAVDPDERPFRGGMASDRSQEVGR